MKRLRNLPSYLRLLVVPLLLHSSGAKAQASRQTNVDEVEQLRETVRLLQDRVAALEAEVHKKSGGSESSDGSHSGTEAAAALVKATSELSAGADPAVVSPVLQAAPSLPSILPTHLPGGATLGYAIDGYYEYDFNHPIGRVEYLRAYDVLSNVFSLNQASIVFNLDPDLGAGRRYGLRLDLQFGQATETLQGNPANEPRPEIYRNIFQAYGTYIAPIGSGLTLNIGKWASSLGIEGNYTKDQMNYSRSFYFDYLPFYHMGVNANYKVNDRLALNYWVVNGNNQTEPTNSFKDELFGFVVQPKKNISWTVNYYLGQDHPDVTQQSDCGSAPVQPGLCFTPISPAPDGKLHIFDSYATWNTNPKLTFAIEGDYVIEREWAHAAPGESSAPSHVDGGAAYAHYQWTPRVALAARTEYLSDRGGLFSGTTQALKESTGTYEYKFADGFLARLEYRRDWTNVPFFLTNKPGLLSPHQTTATVGLVWWYGGKQGLW